MELGGQQWIRVRFIESKFSFTACIPDFLVVLPACLTLAVGSKKKENADLPTGIYRRKGGSTLKEDFLLGSW